MTNVSDRKMNGSESKIAEPIYIYLAALREDVNVPPTYAIFQGGEEQWVKIKELGGGDRIEHCWRALLAIVKHIPEGSSAMVFSNEREFYRQFSGDALVETPRQAELKARVLEVMTLRTLNISVTWVRPTWNIAWTKLLEPLLNRD